MWNETWMHGGHGPWGWISMAGMGLFWFVLLAVAVVLVLRLFPGRAWGGPAARDDTPLEILKRRYARGEIDRDELEQRRRDLTS